MSPLKYIGTKTLAALSILPYFKGKGLIAIAILKLCKGTLPLPVTLRNGAQMWLALNTSGNSLLPYWIRKYESGFQTLFLHCCTQIGETEAIVDVGANVGLYTILAAQQRRAHRDSHVISIEPYPPNAAHVIENVKLNDFGNVQVKEQAIGSSAGSTDLFVAQEAIMWGSLAAVNSVLTEKIQVPIGTLDELRRTEALTVGLLKVDIEGGEFGAFQGAQELLRRNQPYLLFEEDDGFCRSFGHTAADVRNLLIQLGYQIYAIEPHGRTGYQLIAGDNAPILSNGQRNLFGLTQRRTLPS